MNVFTPNVLALSHSILFTSFLLFQKRWHIRTMNKSQANSDYVQVPAYVPMCLNRTLFTGSKLYNIHTFTERHLNGMECKQTNKLLVSCITLTVIIWSKTYNERTCSLARIKRTLPDTRHASQFKHTENFDITAISIFRPILYENYCSHTVYLGLVFEKFSIKTFALTA